MRVAVHILIRCVRPALPRLPEQTASPRIREDRRHIRDADMFAIKDAITVPLNFEMAATVEMLDIALEVKPNAACIVPERREEATTEGGLAVAGREDELLRSFRAFAMPESDCPFSLRPAKPRFARRRLSALILSSFIPVGIAIMPRGARPSWRALPVRLNWLTHLVLNVMPDTAGFRYGRADRSHSGDA